MVSPQAKERLEWIIFYHDVANQHASSTAAYFGLSRKTIHKWLKRFDPHRIQSLEESSRRQKQLRTWEVTPLQEARVKTLREKHLRYGKAKLKVIYEEVYGEAISTWKIERVGSGNTTSILIPQTTNSGCCREGNNGSRNPR